VRFADFLRAAVLLSAGSATALAAVTVIAATRDYEDTLVLVSVGWWLLAGLAGLRMEGRVNDGIARLVAAARYQTTLPELRPATTLLNRLWLLLMVTVVAGVVGIYVTTVPSIAAGFALLVAIAWRRQGNAVAAIEERDAARFYIDRTSPFAPIRLIRTPGFGGTFLRQADSRDPRPAEP
jgi:transposase InsO family protein